MRRFAAAALLVTALVTGSVGGCTAGSRVGTGSGDAVSASGSSTPAAPSTDVTSAAPVPSPSTPPFPADTSPDTGRASAGARLTVSGVEVGAHDGYDRVVLTLGGTGSPGWRAEYVTSAVDDPSDRTVPVDGSAILRLMIDGTGYPQDTGVQEWSGGPLRPTGLVQVRQVDVRGVFEGQTLAFIGLDHVAAFRVFALSGPTRLVVDVQH